MTKCLNPGGVAQPLEPIIRDHAKHACGLRDDLCVGSGAAPRSTTHDGATGPTDASGAGSSASPLDAWRVVCACRLQSCACLLAMARITGRSTI